MPRRSTIAGTLILRPLESSSCGRLSVIAGPSGASSSIRMMPLLWTTDARLMSSRAGDFPKACVRTIIAQRRQACPSGQLAYSRSCSSAAHCSISEAPWQGRSAHFQYAACCLGRRSWPRWHQQLACPPTIQTGISEAVLAIRHITSCLKQHAQHAHLKQRHVHWA